MTDNQKESAAKSLDDQAWAMLREQHDRIHRIAHEGPSRDGDMELVRKVMLVVDGRLFLQLAERKREDAAGPY
jgi:hypothetical protein